MHRAVPTKMNRHRLNRRLYVRHGRWANTIKVEGEPAAAKAKRVPLYIYRLPLHLQGSIGYHFAL